MDSPPRRPTGPVTLNLLKNVLNNSGKKWAFSGSQAMKIHGNAQGVNTRVPHNFNIVTNKSSIQHLLYPLMSLGYSRNNYFPLNGKKLYNKVTLYKNGNKSIDILVAGSSLAPTMNHTTKVNGYPVVTLEKLISQKKGSMPNSENIITLIKLLHGHSKKH